jgi:transcriptional regulator with XRE-family HTH domain
MSETLKQLQAKYDKLGLSRTELAHELGISIATLDRMLANKDALPRYTKVGRQYLFLLTDVAAFFEGEIQTNKKEDGE